MNNAVEVVEDEEIKVLAGVRPGFDPKHYLNRRSMALYDLLTAPAASDRSAQFHAQVAGLVEKHPTLTDGEIALILRTNPNGAWLKYLEPCDRVVEEVARSRANLEADQVQATSLLDDVEQHWVYVSTWKRFLNPETGDLLDKEGMTDHYSDDLDKVASRLLSRKSFRRVLRVDYLPGEAQIVNGVLNQWRPSELEPVPGDVSLFVRHMELLVPTEWERNHLLDCCAFIQQHPGRKLRQAVLIQGNQRVGKSLIARVMELCVGQHNRVVAENNHLNNRFNGWMAGKALIVIEELMQHGRLEVYNKVKPWITQDTIEIEKKGKDHIEVKNVSYLMCFTNHQDSIIIEDKDERFFVINSPMERQPDDYYPQIFTWLRDGGASAVLDWLLKRNLNHFNPDGNAPMTEAKAKLIGDTRTELRKRLVRMLEDCHFPFDRPVFSAEEVRQHVGMPTKEGAVEHQLAKVGCISLGQVRRVRGQAEKVRLWARPKHEDVVSSERDWTQAAEEEIRTAWNCLGR